MSLSPREVKILEVALGSKFTVFLKIPEKYILSKASTTTVLASSSAVPPKPFAQIKFRLASYLARNISLIPFEVILNVFAEGSKSSVLV